MRCHNCSRHTNNKEKNNVGANIARPHIEEITRKVGGEKNETKTYSIYNNSNDSNIIKWKF